MHILRLNGFVGVLYWYTTDISVFSNNTWHPNTKTNKHFTIQMEYVNDIKIRNR